MAKVVCPDVGLSPMVVMFCVLIAVLSVILLLFRKESIESGVSDKVDVMIVGCGVPEKGMGWYHATNIIDGLIPAANFTDVVEAYMLGLGKDTPGGKQFAEFAKYGATKGIKFWANLADVPMASGKKLALIAGRTSDNPRLLKEVIAKGCSHIYLEKPGATTVGELEEMVAYAASRNVKVFMGYNKNVTSYVQKARAYAAKNSGAVTTFTHNNAYKDTEEALAECFERNAEGMLKNMLIHELALLVTYYGVTAETVDSVKVDKKYSLLKTLKGPSTNKSFTDFVKIGFTITTTEGKVVSVKGDRCGGNTSLADVSVDGSDVFQSMTPDKELAIRVDKEQKLYPERMPYFLSQHDDYITLKSRVCSHIATNAAGSPDGIATIEIGVGALKLAERLEPILKKELGAK